MVEVGRGTWPGRPGLAHPSGLAPRSRGQRGFLEPEDRRSAAPRRRDLRLLVRGPRPLARARRGRAPRPCARRVAVPLGALWWGRADPCARGRRAGITPPCQRSAERPASTDARQPRVPPCPTRAAIVEPPHGGEQRIGAWSGSGRPAVGRTGRAARPGLPRVPRDRVWRFVGNIDEAPHAPCRPGPARPRRTAPRHDLGAYRVAADPAARSPGGSDRHRAGGGARRRGRGRRSGGTVPGAVPARAR